MSILVAVACIFGSVACILLGVATCVAASTRIPGVNEPGYMDKREVL